MNSIINFECKLVIISIRLMEVNKLLVNANIKLSLAIIIIIKIIIKFIFNIVIIINITEDLGVHIIKDLFTFFISKIKLLKNSNFIDTY